MLKPQATEAERRIRVLLSLYLAAHDRHAECSREFQRAERVAHKLLERSRLDEKEIFRISGSDAADRAMLDAYKNKRQALERLLKSVSVVNVVSRHMVMGTIVATQPEQHRPANSNRRDAPRRCGSGAST